MKNKLYTIINGIHTELKGTELEEHKKIIEVHQSNEIEEIKNSKIEELNKKTKKIFYDKYPLHRQCNIAIFGTEEEKKEFEEFHKIEANKYDQQLENINSRNELKQLLNLKI